MGGLRPDRLRERYRGAARHRRILCCRGDIRGTSTGQHLSAHQARTEPLLTAFGEWLRAQHCRVSAKSRPGESLPKSITNGTRCGPTSLMVASKSTPTGSIIPSRLDEGEPNDLAIPARELQPIGAPAQIGAHNHDLALRPSMRSSSRTRSSSFSLPNCRQQARQNPRQQHLPAQEPAPPVKQIGRNAMAASGGRDRLAWLETLLDDCQLLLGCPPPAGTSPVSNSTCQYSLDISPSSSLCLSLSAYADCPVEMGGQFNHRHRALP